MKRFNFYFDQLVTYTELNNAFAAAEQADRDLILDQQFVGMVRGGGVGQHSPTPDLTVDVDGGAAGYDADGQRVAWASLQRVNLAVDSNAVTTSVTSGANEKWVSIFVAFKRDNSDLRQDGNNDNVFFQSAESFEFTVVQGVEAATGTSTRPNLIAGKILLADVLRTNGQTQILDADISITRRQDQVVLAGTPLSIRSGFFKDAILDMLTALNAHITSVGFGHDATAIDYGGGAAWADGTTNPSADVEAVLDSIFTRLGSGDGAGKIAYNGGSAWADTTTNPAATLGAQVDKIIADLAAVADGAAGTNKVGSGALSSGAFAVVAGTLASQLTAILAHLNGLQAQRTIVADATLDSGGRDVTIFVDTAAARSITLVAPATFGAGRRVLIVDTKGTADANPITLVRAGTEKINGLAASKVLSAPWGRWTLTSDGTDFFIG